MSFDYLRRLLGAPLQQRVAAARGSLGASPEPMDYEAYFKDVFAGQIL